MNSWQEIVAQLFPILGEAGCKQLTKLLDQTATDQQGWKKTVLLLVADAVEQHGPKGLDIALVAINDLFVGKSPVIDWANPRRVSDLVAFMQNAEADEKSAMHAFGVEVCATLGMILAGLLKGLLATL